MSDRCKSELIPSASKVENETQHAFVEKIFERINVTGWTWPVPMSGKTAEKIRRKTAEDLRESRAALQSLADFVSRLAPRIQPADGFFVRPNRFLLIGKPRKTKPKVVFAVMAWDLTSTVLPVVKAILDAAGYTVTHAGDRGGQVIFDDIWGLMTEAEVVLVDFTGRRPNVYLEFGMAIVLGKPIVATTQRKDDLPSDTPNLKYIHYLDKIGDRTLQEGLVNAIKDTVRDITSA